MLSCIFLITFQCYCLQPAQGQKQVPDQAKFSVVSSATVMFSTWRDDPISRVPLTVEQSLHTGKTKLPAPMT